MMLHSVHVATYHSITIISGIFMITMDNTNADSITKSFVAIMVVLVEIAQRDTHD